MKRTTHAKITINDAGETEVRQLDVVADAPPGRRHSLLNIDMSQAIERIDQESVDIVLRTRTAILTLHEHDRRSLWNLLKDHICLRCGDDLRIGGCPICYDPSRERPRGS
ncbi:MAG: hypothetical protein KGL39_16225 [Patescibacteria group bacterium]|nr:hypothetical protein [Patescibacteria group bacterium]